MIAQDIANAKSAELRASDAAMQRAAALARSIAIRTNTGVVIVRDQKPVMISAKELVEVHSEKT
ncbi:MAG: hypothetical protein ACKN94_12070 [Pirellulaceae bacterium]